MVLQNFVRFIAGYLRDNSSIQYIRMRIQDMLQFSWRYLMQDLYQYHTNTNKICEIKLSNGNVIAVLN